jgi:phosphoglycolate phosphatase
MTRGDLSGATIVFDLDGTLIDTAPDLVRALNRTLDLEGLPRTPVAEMRKIVGQGARALIERGAALADVRFSSERLDELTDAFIAFYSAEIALESAPFPGALEALDAFAAAGVTLAICTNKRTRLSRQLLGELGLEARFAAIVGADSVTARKPHPDHYREAVARAGGRLGHSLMVGDTSADVAAAKAAGAPVIVVRFGYSEAAPETLGADAIISHFSELPAIARRFLGREA